MTEPSAPRRFRPRDAVFAVVVVVGVLWGINAAIEGLERSGAVSTTRPDDLVLFVGEPILEQEGDHYVTSEYGRKNLVSSRFGTDPDANWQAFLVGGSFMMGTPYVHHEHETERAGGIPFWLRHEYEEADGVVEIVNLGAGAQNSNRVSSIARVVVPLKPDVLVVATCNNEGVLPPSRLREELHQLGGYRLLAKYIAPAAGDEERSYYTPQLEEAHALLGAFERSLQEIADAAAEAEVPLVLVTLPVHLAYRGRAWSHGVAPDQAFTNPDPCIAEGVHLLSWEDPEGAISRLEQCEDTAEALRWIGMSLKQLERYPEASRALEQSVELRPRNRCRPSFNDAIRAVAEASEAICLVDLDRRAREVSPGGIPGDNLFLDYCHLDYAGYALMAREIRDGMAACGIAPPGVGPSSEPLDVARIALEEQIPELDHGRLWQ
ncbi:MAG: tetratricopeptide repeat protein [Proteobacteria bacterium]|nr:tetratricopeptide repeat protein [Pseudomonadota bacterium]